MSYNSFTLTSSDEKALHKMIESGFDDLSLRAQIILNIAHGKRGINIAKELNITVQTVTKWKKRFVELGVDGLKSNYGPKGNAKQSAEQQKIEEEIRNILETEEGSRMTVAQLGECAGVSTSKAYRIKRKFDHTTTKRQTSWTYETVDLQVGNSPYMIGLYLKAGVCAIVLCNTAEMLDGKTIHGSLWTRNSKFVKDLEQSTSTLRLSDTLVSSMNYLSFRHAGEGLSANAFLSDTIDCWPDDEDYHFSVIYMSHKPMRYAGNKLPRIQYFQYQEFDALVQKVQGSFLGLEQKKRLDDMTNILKLASNYLVAAPTDSDPFCWHILYGDFSPLVTALTSPDCSGIGKEGIDFLKNDVMDLARLGLSNQTDNCTMVSIVIYIQEADGQLTQKVVPANAILPEINEDLIKTPEGIKNTLNKLDREMTQLAKKVDYTGREMYLENIKKKYPLGILIMVEVEFCIGRIRTYVPLSAVPFLHAGERILTSEYRKTICRLSTNANYKFACDDFNQSNHRDKDACLSKTTLRNDVIHEGIRLIQAKQKYVEELLSSYGFDPLTCKYRGDNIPENLQNQSPEWVGVTPTVDIHSPPIDEWDPQNPSLEIPDNYLFVKEPKASKSNFTSSETLDDDVKDTEMLEQDLSQDDEEPEYDQKDCKDQTGHDGGNKSTEKKQEYSCPDNDTTKYLPKRRGPRIEQPPEKKQSVIDNYVQWRNENVKNEISKIRYLWKIEKDSSEVVYISIDAVLVPMQSTTHVKGGKPYKETSKENVVHWNTKVEWDEKSYAITGTRESVYPQLIAFLLWSRLCKRYMIFFTDGETCIFDDIKSYFSYWHYAIYIDYHHVEKKVHELLSLSIIQKRVGDPREEPEYYVKGKKKGQIKKQVQVSLSVLYARVVTSTLFAGNWKEAILYLSNIDPAHVKNPDRLNELIKYIWRKRHYMTCYAIRRKCGLRNSSNGAESLNNQCVSERQKGERRNWQSKGSASLAALSVCFLNGESDAWFDKEEFEFNIKSVTDSK